MCSRFWSSDMLERKEAATDAARRQRADAGEVPAVGEEPVAGVTGVVGAALESRFLPPICEKRVSHCPDRTLPRSTSSMI